jgi:hypothetical protein
MVLVLVRNRKGDTWVVESEDTTSRRRCHTISLKKSKSKS